MSSPTMVRLRPLLIVLAGGVSTALATCVVNRASEDAASVSPESRPSAAASGPALAPSPLASASSLPAPSAAPAASLEPRPFLPTSKSMLPLQLPTPALSAEPGASEGRAP